MPTLPLVRRCYQPTEIHLEALLDVLCLLLEETPKSSPTGKPASTCVQTPAE